MPLNLLTASTGCDITIYLIRCDARELLTLGLQALFDKPEGLLSATAKGKDYPKGRRPPGLSAE